MSAAGTRVFAARLAGIDVFDPLGDKVGRVRDVVALVAPGQPRPRVVGLVVEVSGRRRVFLPMTRVTSIAAGQVISTGLVNMRRFEQRPTETLLLGELLDRTVTLVAGAGPSSSATGPLREATIEDVAIEQSRPKEWRVTKFFVRTLEPGRRGRLARQLGRRGATFVVEFQDVLDLGILEQRQGAANLLAAFEGLKAPDLAEMIHELSPKRRLEVASALDDDRLADVLEELPEDDQVEILSQLGADRAADVLEAMQPDDAADLLSDLPAEQAERLLALMEPDEAEDVRRLLAYEERTAGGVMTSEPIVLPPEATIATALAQVRREDVSPALAAAVFVCRPPLEAPTGRYLGMVHIQRLLRDPPHSLLGGIVDKDVEPLDAEAPLDTVTRRLATYNLVSLPVTDAQNHLIGVVTVDDVLDHLLPDDWREQPEDEDEVHLHG